MTGWLNRVNSKVTFCLLYCFSPSQFCIWFSDLCSRSCSNSRHLPCLRCGSNSQHVGFWWKYSQWRSLHRHDEVRFAGEGTYTLFQNWCKLERKQTERKEKNLHSRTNCNVHQHNFCRKFVGWHAEMGPSKGRHLRRKKNKRQH